jgi:MFS family permease
MTTELSPRTERFFLLTLAGIQFSHVLDFMIMMPLGPILMAAFRHWNARVRLAGGVLQFQRGDLRGTGGDLCRPFERKRLLLIVFALFALATLACGLAPSYSTLMVARGLAGVFGGIMGAMVQTMIGDVIPFSRRARASGVVSSCLFDFNDCRCAFVAVAGQSSRLAGAVRADRGAERALSSSSACVSCPSCATT